MTHEVFAHCADVHTFRHAAFAIQGFDSCTAWEALPSASQEMWLTAFGRRDFDAAYDLALAEVAGALDAFMAKLEAKHV